MKFAMKKTIKFFLAAVCAAPMILSGCQREFVPEAPAKINVRIADNDDQTRTSYDNVQGKFTWTEGDEVALYLKNWGYETFALTVDEDDASLASILSSSVGTHIRDGYAVYPASAAVNPAAGSTALKVTLPAEYDLTALTDFDEEYATALLLAKNVPDQDLEFFHAGGLARFVLTDVARNTTKIVVTFDKEVTGEFEVVTNDTAEPIPYIATRDGEGTSVAFIVSSSVIGSDKAINLNLPVPCGTYAWAKVEFFVGDVLQEDKTLMHASPMEFSRHHGKRIAFVEADWDLYIGNQVGTSIGNITVPSGTPTVDNDGGVLTLAESFVSYKTDGEHYEPVPFHLEYSTNGTSWTTEIPDWLSFASTVDPNGSVPDFPQELSIVINPLKNQIPMNDFGVPIPDGSHSAALHNATPHPDVVDLSTKNVAKGTTVPTTTANCYIVDAPGTYTFPFVYGNGVQNGAPYEPAYHGMMKNADTGAYEFRPDAPVRYTSSTPYAMILGRFLDHAGNLIMSPYIREQLGADSYTAKVLWMDQPGLIESVQYVDGTPETAHIQFVVSPGGIAQGNALIGVLNGAGTIVWSWHIWITDEDMTQTTRLKAESSTGDGVQMAPVNLGWINQVQITQYSRITGRVRIVQDEAGGKASNNVRFTVGTDSQEYRYGHAPYYSNGRKDPVMGYNGNRNFYGPKAVYPVREDNPYYPQYAILQMTTLQETIQHPYIYYYPDQGVTRVLEIAYGNQWNSTQTIFNSTTTSPASFYSDPVTKTIYDPSPVGYRIPSAAVFADVTFDEVQQYTQSSSEAFDGVAIFQIDQTKFPRLGYLEKYLRNIGSGVSHYYCAEGRYYSSTFRHTYYYWYTSTRQSNIQINFAAYSVRSTVDE